MVPVQVTEVARLVKLSEFKSRNLFKKNNSRATLQKMKNTQLSLASDTITWQVEYLTHRTIYPSSGTLTKLITC